MTLYSPTRLSDGRWHHVVWTRSAAGENCLYIDGNLAAVGSDGGGTDQQRRPITIGGDPVLGGRDLVGAMDEVAIYDHVLVGRAGCRPIFARPSRRAAGCLPTLSAPLVEHRCARCHSGDEPKGGLDLTTRAGLLAGGDSGAAVDRAASAVKPAVSADHARRRAATCRPAPIGCPTRRLPASAEWIDAGVPYDRTLRPIGGAGRDFWSFRRLGAGGAAGRREGPTWPHGGIDSFVLSALAARGAKPDPRPTAAR